jgi:hypothetical protein
LELIAFGEAGCFGAADAAELLEYCARLLDAGCCRCCWVVGCWMPLTLLRRWVLLVLLGSWVLGAADAAG